MAELVSGLGDLTSVKAEIEEKVLPEVPAIPVELMTGLGKLLKVVNSEEGAAKFVMRDSAVEIILTKPVYVTEVLLELGSLDSVKGMKLICSDLLTGKAEKVSITVERNSGSSVRFIVNKVITSFVLKRESLFQKDITKIVVRGIAANELEKFEKEFKSLVQYKDELLHLIDGKQDELNDRERALREEKSAFEATKVEAEEELENMNAEVSSLTQKLTELNSSLRAATNDVEQKKSQRAELVAKYDELEKRSLATESELSQKLQTLANTNIAISNREQKLNELVGNVNVFSEEFSGFVDQGTRQIRLYAIFTLVPFTLLSIVVFYLFNGAVDLSTKFQSMARIDLVTLFVTRLPFVTVAAFIVGISIKVLFFLVNRIIAIHQQRLDLAKIAIIAKDVSDASATNLGMSSEERYEAKTYLKMSILRAYLSDQIAKFSYAQRKNDELHNDDVPQAAEQVSQSGGVQQMQS